MKERDVTVYNKETLFEAEVRPKLKEMMRICAIHEIPCFATFAVKNSQSGTKYVSDMVSATGTTNDVCLKKDNIRKCANVLNGFDTVAENKVLEIDM